MIIDVRCDERAVTVCDVHVLTASLTRVCIEWNGRRRNVASVYVPVKPADRRN